MGASVEAEQVMRSSAATPRGEQLEVRKDEERLWCLRIIWFHLAIRSSEPKSSTLALGFPLLNQPILALLQAHPMQVSPESAVEIKLFIKPHPVSSMEDEEPSLYHPCCSDARDGIVEQRPCNEFESPDIDHVRQAIEVREDGTEGLCESRTRRPKFCSRTLKKFLGRDLSCYGHPNASSDGITNLLLDGVRCFNYERATANVLAEKYIVRERSNWECSGGEGCALCCRLIHFGEGLCWLAIHDVLLPDLKCSRGFHLQ
ncbi:hypothetical protein Nepgr_010195 [Nepenthes gracilis]|uniref:Uncharacterized protein n=1 Tax=Nepenthes gracilis TaxID=150966 RepID=A0AAD3XL34_NEPGR|nr:hypothetical protein Nepgr_010195 [Nepenthes gracilis]